jgi:hypothetical protein
MCDIDLFTDFEGLDLDQIYNSNMSVFVKLSKVALEKYYYDEEITLLEGEVGEIVDYGIILKCGYGYQVEFMNSDLLYLFEEEDLEIVDIR